MFRKRDSIAGGVDQWFFSLTCRLVPATVVPSLYRNSSRASSSANVPGFSAATRGALLEACWS